MTSQYVTEPPTSGLVELVTSKGTISIELFARETPLACRNFLTLALEGFYDNLIFHRLIPNFIIQSGDPSGTGDGGESIYGVPFAVESHSRLIFNRRGLLGMAAEDKTNESQFFLTLDATPELQGKHTMMGRVVGKTIYNLMELAQGVELNGDRPRYPPKLIEVKVVENPFDDLKPRMTKLQRREQERMRKEEEERRKVEEEKRKRGKVKKNTKLLSFGADEEEGGEVEEVVLKGPKSSHDLLSDDRRLSKRTMEERGERKRSKREGEAVASQSAAIESKTDAGAEASSTKPVHAVTPSLNTTASPPKDTQPTPSTTTAKSYLTAQRAKYTSKLPESDTYTALLSFQSRLRHSTLPVSHSSTHPTPPDHPDDDDDEEAKEYGASDDDADWRSHRLDAGGQPLVASNHKADDYEVLDPRDHASKSDEKLGKRGRDWVDDKRIYRDDHRRPSSSKSSRSHRHQYHR